MEGFPWETTPNNMGVEGSVYKWVLLLLATNDPTSYRHGLEIIKIDGICIKALTFLLGSSLKKSFESCYVSVSKANRFNRNYYRKRPSFHGNSVKVDDFKSVVIWRKFTLLSNQPLTTYDITTRALYDSQSWVLFCCEFIGWRTLVCCCGTQFSTTTSWRCTSQPASDWVEGRSVVLLLLLVALSVGSTPKQSGSARLLFAAESTCWHQSIVTQF